MEKNEIKAVIKKDIIERLELFIDENEISDSAPLFGYDDNGAGLGLDSIDVLEIIVIIKKNFSVEINGNDDRKNFENLNTLVDLVYSKMPQQ